MKEQHWKLPLLYNSRDLTRQEQDIVSREDNLVQLKL